MPVLDPDALLIFAAACLLFAVFPGPAVVYIVTRSVAQGRTAGIVSALGIETGNLAHVVAATLGLSVVLASSALAFGVVRYLGAAYLVYLGVRELLRRERARPVAEVRPGQLRRVYLQGAVVALLNPKTALFFLAFLPQFVAPARGSTAVQIGLLGVLLVAVTTVSDLLYALLSGTAGAWVRGRHGFGRWRRFVSGGVYLSLGLSAALGGPKPERP
jgi:threonine/homoserine/homoserine lactone efflux protein